MFVAKGDILIGGRNFGMGSSRPAARSLRNLEDLRAWSADRSTDSSFAIA